MEKGEGSGNVWLVLGSVVFCLLLMEIFLAIDDWRPAVDSAEIDLGGERYQFLDDAERFDHAEKAVAFIGDSFTLGVGCGRQGNYPAAASRLLEEKGTGLEALNLGVAGADPFRYLSITEDLLTSGRVPRSIVVTLYVNDMDLLCPVCAHRERIAASGRFSAAEIVEIDSLCTECAKTGNAERTNFSLARRIHWALMTSRLYTLLREGFAKASVRVGLDIGWGRSSYPAYWGDPESFRFRLLRLALEGVRDRAARASVPLMVVIFPDVSEIRETNPYVEIYRNAAAALSTELGIPVLSGYEALLGDPSTKNDMTFSLTDHHPSCEANEIFARWVVESLWQRTDARPRVGAAPAAQ